MRAVIAISILGLVLSVGALVFVKSLREPSEPRLEPEAATGAPAPEPRPTPQPPVEPPAPETAPPVEAAHASEPRPPATGFRLCGVVIDRDTQRPVATASVLFTGEGAERWEATTGPDGRFRIDLPKWPRQDGMLIRCKGYADRPVSFFRRPKSGEPITVTLHRRARVTGRVTDPGGVARTDVVVVIDNAGDAAMTQAMGSRTDIPTLVLEHCAVDESGVFAADELPAGVALRARVRPREGRETPERMMMGALSGTTNDVRLAEATFTLKADELRVIDITVPRGVNVAGVVRDQQGRIVVGTTVFLTRTAFLGDFTNPVADTRTDADGRYRLDDVQPGSYFLVLLNANAPKRERIARAFTPIELPAGEAEKRQDLVVYRGLTITGVVTDPGGTPRRATITASHDNESFNVEVVAKENGEFAAGPLIPGSYDLFAYKQQAYTAAAREWVPSDVVRARDGDGGIRLRLRKTARITGTVIGDDVARRSTRLWTYCRHGADSILGETHGEPVGDDGRFTIARLRPGRHDLIAIDAKSRIASGSATVAEGGVATGIELRLRPSGRVRISSPARTRHVVTVRTESGVVLYHSHVADEVIVFAPPGRVRVTIADDGDPVRDAWVTVHAGEETAVKSDPK